MAAFIFGSYGNIKTIKKYAIQNTDVFFFLYHVYKYETVADPTKKNGALELTAVENFSNAK